MLLTSTFGNEPFYESLGFRRHRTAMAIYPPERGNSPYLYPVGTVLPDRSGPEDPGRG